MLHITAAGYIGQDADLRQTPGSETVCSINLGVQGRGDAPTQWVRCTLWGARAQALAQYLTKGSFLVVSGSGRMDEYTDKNGEKRTNLAIYSVDQVTFGPKTPQNSQKSPVSAQKVPKKTLKAPEYEDDDGDIPF